MVLSRIIGLLLVLACTSVSVQSVSDQDMNNNNFSMTISVLSSPNFSMMFVPYIQNSSDSVPDFTELALNQTEFIKNIFPIQEETDIHIGLPFISKEKNPNVIRNLTQSWLVDLEEAKWITGTNATRVIGVLSPSLKNLVGFGYSFGVSDVVAAGNPLAVTSAAHEIIHTYSGCDEYNRSVYNSQRNRMECINGDADNNHAFDLRCEGIYENYNSTACTVDNSSLVIETFFPNLSIDNLSNVMGARYSAENKSYRRWISNETYSGLYYKMYVPREKSWLKRIIARFSILESGEASFKEYLYSVPTEVGSDQVDFTQGNFTIRAIGNGGAIITQYNLSPNFVMFSDQGDVVETDTSEFIVLLPFENISSIEIINRITNSSLSKKNISLNPPIVFLVTQFNRSTYQSDKLLFINWSSTDVDSNPLTHGIEMSTDGGSEFYPLILDYNSTNITLNSSLFFEGDKFKIKILVSDGINTNSTMSTGNFSIRNAPTIVNLTNLSSNLSVYEFKINASSIFNFSNVSWTLRAGENLSINSTIPFNISSWKDVIVFVEYNSTNETVTEANVTVTSENLTGFTYLRFPHGILVIDNFTVFATSGSVKTFETVVRNSGDLGIQGINWTLATGDNQGTTNIPSGQGFDLTAGGNVTVFIEYNYTNTSATHEATISFNSTQSRTQSSINVTFTSGGLQITNFSVIDRSQFNTTFEMIILNPGDANTLNTWSLNTGDGNIQSTAGYNLTSNQSIIIFIAHNYSHFGQYNPAASVNTNEDTKYGSVNISEFTISNLSSLVESGLNRTFEFIIQNVWNTRLAANWSINTGTEIINSTQSVSANNGENITAYVEYAYPGLQNRTITATVFTNQSNHSQSISI